MPKKVSICFDASPCNTRRVLSRALLSVFAKCVLNVFSATFALVTLAFSRDRNSSLRRESFPQFKCIPFNCLQILQNVQHLLPTRLSLHQASAASASLRQNQSAISNTSNQPVQEPQNRTACCPFACPRYQHKPMHAAESIAHDGFDCRAHVSVCSKSLCFPCRAWRNGRVRGQEQVAVHL